MVDTIDLKNRFRGHDLDDDDNDLCVEIRNLFEETASIINGWCPESREKSLAMTKLEEAMFWSNASIARNQKDK